MPDFHPASSPNAPANDSQWEQGGFRNTSFPFFSLQLVNAICDKGDDIDEYKIIETINHHTFTIQ
jgi:hypothetical protein